LCTLFSQLFRVRVVLSRWTFYKKCFFRWGTKKMLYIQNWWTIPLSKVSFFLRWIFFILHFTFSAGFYQKLKNPLLIISNNYKHLRETPKFIWINSAHCCNSSPFYQSVEQCLRKSTVRYSIGAVNYVDIACVNWLTHINAWIWILNMLLS